MALDTHVNVATDIRREDGNHTIEVRWPTDQEWLERSRGWYANIHRKGRGVSENQIEPQQADLKLYEHIRQEGSADLGVDEASRIVEALTRCDITGVALEMDEATVEMTVTGSAKVSHRLRIPTTAAVVQFRRTAGRLIDLPHGRQQVRINLQAGLDLYAKCAVATEGYANGVPAIHKDAAIRAVMDACDAQVEASPDEDF